VATVKSPVAAFESKSPSVRKKDVERCYLPRPSVVPENSILPHGLNVFTTFRTYPFGWF